MTGQDPSPLELTTAVTNRPGWASSVGIRVVTAEAGAVEMVLDRRADLVQFNGYFHGGVITGLADHAAGGAVSTALPPSRVAVTIDLHINFVQPADGDVLIARGRAVNIGRTISTAVVEVASSNHVGEHECALVVATLRAVGSPPP